jgi:hypothetical protein
MPDAPRLCRRHGSRFLCWSVFMDPTKRLLGRAICSAAGSSVFSPRWTTGGAATGTAVSGRVTHATLGSPGTPATYLWGDPRSRVSSSSAFPGCVAVPARGRGDQAGGPRSEDRQARCQRGPAPGEPYGRVSPRPSPPGRGSGDPARRSRMAAGRPDLSRCAETLLRSHDDG